MFWKWTNRDSLFWHRLPLCPVKDCGDSTLKSRQQEVTSMDEKPKKKGRKMKQLKKAIWWACGLFQAFFVILIKFGSFLQHCMSYLAGHTVFSQYKRVQASCWMGGSLLEIKENEIVVLVRMFRMVLQGLWWRIWDKDMHQCFWKEICW